MFSTGLSVAGCQRVEGDEEEDDVDDLENEQDFDGGNEQDLKTTMSHEVYSFVPNIPIAMFHICNVI